jgi:hypothetical protein
MSVLKPFLLGLAMTASAMAATAQPQRSSGSVATAGPQRIAVLVDSSQAVRPYINDMRQGLRAFVRQMQGDHEIALYEFGDRPSLLTDFTSDPAKLDAAVGRLFSRSGSGSYVLDAIIEASRHLRGREGADPVIVVITAEGPEFSQRIHQDVLDELKASGATLHSFVLTRVRSSLLNQAAREREFTLTRGADLTGGRRVDLLTSMSLGDRLGALARELKDATPTAGIPQSVPVPATRARR